MKTAPMWISLMLAVGVVTIGLGIDSEGWSGAAVAQKRSQGTESVDRIVSSLRAVDTAYASGNAAEAQIRFTEARAGWNSVAPRISAGEAREQQLLFDSLEKQLKSGAPANEVKSKVSGMIDELHEDIERELR
jgi:hypothetical protein